MSLTLGKVFDRNYSMRVPFLDGFYDIGIFFNKKSNFLLFSVNSDFFTGQNSAKINMFKNIESSRFCETFLNLHNYRGSNLDIVNQFDSIKSDYHLDITFLMTETITLSKVTHDNKTFFNTLLIYGFTITAIPSNEYIFILAERQFINTKINKKIIRTTGIQLSTTKGINVLNDFYDESRKFGKEGLEPVRGDPEKTIKFE